MKQPLAVIMLRFYRHCVQRLRDLEAQHDKDAADLQDMDRLRSVLETDEAPETFLERIEKAWKGRLTTSGDAIWDSWMEAVKTGNIPDEWWGPLKDGVRG